MDNTFLYASCLESKNIEMDLGCLEMKNTDATRTIDVWGQSKECYECSFWHLASIEPQKNITLLVNTTYPTLFGSYYLEHRLYGFEYHFGDSGSYLLQLNSTNYAIQQLHRHSNIYLPLLYAFMFYFMLAMIWLCTTGLRKKMDSGRDDEQQPILRPSSSNRRRYGGVNEDASTSSSASTSAQQTLPSHYSASERIPTDTDTSSPNAVVQSSSGKVRLHSLDAFRGITIFMMIFVNYGGGRYYFFAHSPWNGLTVADLIFPWFMWIMGVSLVFSVRSQLQRGLSRKKIISKIVKRSLILFALGIMVNGISHNDIDTLRIPGVLQRFAGCYLLTAILETLLMDVSYNYDPDSWLGWYVFRDVTTAWFQWAIIFGLVSIHTIITFVMPIPDCPRGYIGPGGLHEHGQYPNCTGGAAAYIDRVIFGPEHMYKHSTATKVYANSTPCDPEGFLGWLTSMLVVQFGVAAGRILMHHESHRLRVIKLLCWAVSCGLIGGAFCAFSKEFGVIPINKNLWSLSYVLVNSCFAFILFCFVYVVVDWLRVWDGSPARYAGLNSILLYVGHELTRDVFPFSWTPVGNTHGHWLLMNLWATSLWGIIAYICHLKELYVSV